MIGTFCQYREAFGKPGEGVHAHRTLGLATTDLVATLAIGGVIGYTLTRSVNGILLAIVGLVVLATLLHLLFGVQTAGLTMLGLHTGVCPK